MKCRRYLYLGICFLIFVMNIGCRSQSPSVQKTSGQQIEISMMYPMDLSHFTELVKTEYPDIDLQVEMTTTAVMNGDSERRLRKGHGTDLVITTLPTGEVKEYVLDLSAEAFAARYQGSVASPVMIEGQTRYLPLPGQYTGYILNKTIVEQLEKKIPSSNSELTEIFRAGKENGSGIGEDGVMFGLATVSPSAVGAFITGMQVPDFLGKAEGIKWMSDFNDGTAGFDGAWNDSLELLTGWAENGYLNAGTLSLRTKNAMPIETRMLDGTLMLCQGNVQMLTKLNSEDSEYEYVMLPYMSSEGNPSWVVSEPDGYIGVNSGLADESERNKMDACIRILDLLSTPEGQAAWMEDTLAPNSYLKDFEPVKDSIPEGIAACVENGYVYNLQMPSNVVQYYGKTMTSVLDHKLDMEEALKTVDDYCQNGSLEVDYGQSVVGSLAEDLIYENYNTRREETEIGNLIADAVKEFSGADIAVVNGGGIRASLYKGDVLGEDLNAVCPYPNKIIVVNAKGSVIVKMLENGISQTVRYETLPSGRFLQVSGICYSYRPKEGETPPELLAVTLADGTELDLDGWYSVAVTDYMAGSNGYMDNNGDGYSMLNLYSDSDPKAEDVELLKETDAAYFDALKQYFQNHRDEPVTAELEGRITAAGAEDE